MINVELNRLTDNQKVIFEIDLSNPLDAEGGEGTIYKSTLQGIEYVIKPIELHSDTKKKYKALNDRIKNIDGSDSLKTKLKERVLHSFIPYAQNFHKGELFGYILTSKIDVFAYSFVKGKKLSEHLSDNIEMSTEERLNICINLLDLLDFMQRDCGILHADIFEDNFIIDSAGNLFPIDSTSCGYFHWNKELKIEEPIYQARNRGKSGNWGIPEPKDFAEGGVTSQYTDRWFAARLVWRILTNRMHPYTFIKHPDNPTLNSFFDNLAFDKNSAWPPYLIDYEHKDFIWNEYHKIREIMLYHLNDQTNEVGYESKIAKCFYDYFIKGYENPKSRPPFKFLRDYISNLAVEYNPINALRNINKSLT